MLPLPTEAAIETMNISTDRRHPSHTYNDRNRFRQFEFTQQNIVVDINDVERHGNLEWKGVIGPLMPRLQSMLLSDFHILT